MSAAEKNTAATVIFLARKKLLLNQCFSKKDPFKAVTTKILRRNFQRNF